MCFIRDFFTSGAGMIEMVLLLNQKRRHRVVLEDADMHLNLSLIHI